MPLRHVFRTSSRALGLALALGLASASQAAAEWEVSVYTGIQEAPHSNVRGTDPTNPNGPNVSFGTAWAGRSFEAPPYYGLRATWWRDARLGFGVEVNHAKVYADGPNAAAAGYSDFELTDGINYVTANVMRRFPDTSYAGFTPYVGAGLGVAVPHVDITTTGGQRTFEYQLTGPAAVVMAGASRPITDRASVFVEYKGAFSQNTFDLEGGGELETDLVTNALNLGLSFRF
ncbi:MAG: outer membrane protein [Shimia sp.]